MLLDYCYLFAGVFGVFNLVLLLLLLGWVGICC